MSQLDKWIVSQTSLHHNNLAQVLGIVSIAENPTIVSEWYPGGNVAKFLKVAPQVQRIRMICQVADGLIYLHSQKPPIIHSNLKPSNVLIDQDGTVKLGDVGVLQFIEQNSIALEVHGKPGDVRWTAPEVLEVNSDSS
ncbi:hypothetical protein FRC05_008303 [Tulasnella sp. 425]|nr:hypothetical protein FRC05_008303 [Tulasnella sp. 425]